MNDDNLKDEEIPEEDEPEEESNTEDDDELDPEIMADLEEMDEDIDLGGKKHGEDSGQEPSAGSMDGSDEEEAESDEEIDEELEETDESLQPQSSEETRQVQLKNVVEAALFVAGRPVSLEELNVKTDIKKRELETILDELAMDYLMRSTAIEIVQIQDKYSLQIKPEYTQNVKKFASGGLIPDKILKTLTIIALKQPLLKSTLIKVRGAGAYDHIKFLLDRGFVEGKKKGRSVELLTTDQFADTFGLSRDLPTMKKQMIAQLGIKDQAE